MRIATRIEELEAIALEMPAQPVLEGIYRVISLMRAILALVSEFPSAFDETSPWWLEWSAKSISPDRPTDLARK
ncbi:hypothetical protein [Sphingomonas sp. 22176]|uniref:hypothetical protein n=1 Tax=Sphingomonas sp. 22176 TaxID=3453884 RepID=UPI003F8278D9